LIKTLYKKDSNGKLMQWTIETIGKSFRTCDGYVGGKITTTSPTICTSKNVGRVNETTPEAQCIIEAKAKVEKKKKERWLDSIEECDFVFDYPLDPMLAREYNKAIKVIEITRYFALQPKLDGIRCTAKRSKPGIYTREGNKIVSCPHIEAMVADIFMNNTWLEAIDGELYNHEFKDNFDEIVSIVRTQLPTEEDLQKSYKYMQYHVYDCVTNNIEDTFKERYEYFSNATFDNYKGGYRISKHLRIVKTKFVQNHEPLVQRIYEMFLEEGYEGMMYRNPLSTYQEGKRTKDLIKRKEHIDKEFILIDVLEGLGNRAGMAGKVVCKIGPHTFEANIKGKNRFNTAFEWFKELLVNKHKYIGEIVTIRYQNLTPDGKPRFGRMIAIRNYE
jgi:DNA ligase-1